MSSRGRWRPRTSADTEALGLGRPDREPLASETIAEIIELIAELIERGHAYAVDGDVYFSVRSYPEYGELSHRRVDEMDQGEGVEGADRKRDPLDFALWKAQKPDEDTAWDAPWGRGRPGWHIECSAMAESILGVDFEIHGGGSDLIFPHHENEAAQTAAARGAPLARLWMHNGMVRLDKEKMAKSVGNIFVLREALGRLRPRRADHVLRLGPLPPADRVRRGAPRAGGGERPPDPRGRAPAPAGPVPGVLGAAQGALLRRRSPTTSTPRAPSRPCSSGCGRRTRPRNRCRRR